MRRVETAGAGFPGAPSLTLFNLGSLLLGLNKTADAEPILREALEIYHKNLGSKADETRQTADRLAKALEPKPSSSINATQSPTLQRRTRRMR